MNTKNIKLRLNLDKENDRKAYEFLRNTEASYSKAVIFVICQYLKLSEKVAAENAFLERIITTIREETAKSNPLNGLLQIVQQPAVPAPTVEKDKSDKEETAATVLEFFDSF